MPVLSWAHSAYWQGVGGGGPVVTGNGIGGYIPWQANIVMSLLLMAVFLAPER